MNNQELAIVKLREVIESTVGRKIRTPRDFDFLSDSISNKLNQRVGITTLKRLWGYVPSDSTPRVSTLDILAQFADYKDWASFCEQEGALVSDDTEEQEPPKRRTYLYGLLLVVFVLAVAVALWILYHRPSEGQSSDQYVLRQGQTFATWRDYLKLFGIQDSTTYWGVTLPHHPNILVWGPEYEHPHWHNYGDFDNMMPTITERWEPEGVDSNVVIMRNRDKFYHELRLNEVRITFMKNLTDTGYVFLGIYRLSLQQSDTSRCVWERVADECDLNHLDYLEELRN